MKRLAAGLVGLFLLAWPVALHAAEPLQVLKGRIIRALAVHPAQPERILVGNKGKQAGSGKVFESRDGGRSWTTLNQGKALDPMAADVQAVAYGPGEAVLAGTWKRGLFISRDGGTNFENIEDFPESDIRDLLVVPGEPNRIYAATGRRGVIASDDGGLTWQVQGPDKTFLWSLARSEEALFAASPNGGLFESRDRGATWSSAFTDEGAYAALAVGDRILLAGETGLHERAAEGDWRKLPVLDGVKLSSLLRGNHQNVLVGAWGGGVTVLSSSGEAIEQLLPKIPVLHVRRAGPRLLVGSWGKGLYIFPERFGGS